MYPILESFIICKICFLFKNKNIFHNLIFVISFTVGWFFHGADSGSIGRGIAFSLLAYLFVNISNSRHWGVAFSAITSAHMLWNSLALATYSITK